MEGHFYDSSSTEVENKCHKNDCEISVENTRVKN